MKAWARLGLAFGVLALEPACRGLLDVEEIVVLSNDVDGGAAGGGGSAPTGAGGMGGGSPCPSVITDSDPRNCGACEHNCLGGSCKAGHCLPVPLATNEAGAFGVAVAYDPQVSVVVWGSDAGVRLGDKFSLVPNATLASVPAGLAIKGLAMPVSSSASKSPQGEWEIPIYYSLVGSGPDSRAGLWKLLLLPGKTTAVSNAQLLDGTSWPSVLAIAAEPRGAFVTLGSGASEIAHVNYDGSNPTPWGSSSLNGVPSGGITMDSARVFWVSEKQSRVRAMNKIGASPGDVSPVEPDFGVVAVDGRYLYWSRAEAHGSETTFLERRPKSGGGTIVDLCQSTSPITSILVDPATLFFATADGGVWSLRLDGKSQPVALVTGLKGPISLAQDAYAIFWASAGDGTVDKLAKPYAP